MSANFDSPDREYNPLPDLAETIRETSRRLIPKTLKLGWVAENMLGLRANTFSQYQTGDRNFPAFLVVAQDNAFHTHNLLEVLAEAEGCGVYTKDPKVITAEELEKIFVLELREDGAAHSEIAQALLDRVLDLKEYAGIHAHAAKMRHLWQTIEEETSPEAVSRLRRQA